MSNFVNFHVLISHSPACLNRDDMNMQKDAVFGGKRRVSPARASNGPFARVIITPAILASRVFVQGNWIFLLKSFVVGWMWTQKRKKPG
jgi:hypothetical protein